MSQIDPSCKACPLHKTTPTVCISGEGPDDAEIFVVGEAPGREEETAARPFVGKSGQKLRELVAMVGMEDNVRYENVCRCRPPENRAPKLPEIRACMRYLDAEIETRKPKYLILLGGSAIKAISGDRSPTVSAMRNVQNWTYRGAKVIATYHPAAPLYQRDRVKREQLWKNMIDDFLRIDSKEFLQPETCEWEVVTKVRSLPHEVALDIETTGLDPWAKDARVLCIGYANEKNKAKITTDIPGFCRALERGRRTIIGHNLRFDLGYLKVVHGLDVTGHTWEDTMLAAHLLDENRPSKGLKHLASIYTGYGDYETHEIRKAKKDGTLAELDTTALFGYCAQDVATTWALRQMFREQMRKSPVERVYVGENRILKTIHAMEVRGMRISKRVIGPVSMELQRKLLDIDQELGTIKPELLLINLNSPSQLSAFLFEQMKLPIVRKTRGGSASVDKTVLEELLQRVKVEKTRRMLSLLLERGVLRTQLGTYIDPYLKLLKPDGRIHASYNPTGTRTSRLSSSKPNLQNIPRTTSGVVRKVFVAPSGMMLAEADYSQIELRVLAVMTRDPRLLMVYTRREDLHTKTAQFVLGKSEVSSDERRLAKSVNFGIIYGIGPKKLAMETGLSFSAARRYIKDWYTLYPLVKRWQECQEKALVDHGYVESMFGRRRHLPLIADPESPEYLHMIRQACNAPIQSTAADLTKMAMSVLNERGHRVIGNVHDSVILEVPKKGWKQACREIAEIMGNANEICKEFGYKVTFPIETPVEVKCGSNWYEMKEVV